MPNYFIEVSYKGTNYSGFQTQKNAHTIQQEVENALSILTKEKFQLIGSSRTDAGVHALQNYFHFQSSEFAFTPKSIYNLNAILPSEVVIKQIVKVDSKAHSRFDAVSREYSYYIYQQKNPFLADRAYFFPYKLDISHMEQAAILLKGKHDFTSFSKRNTQVKTFICNIIESAWRQEGDCFVYRVKANRFLRGMVRGLVGTMLRVGRGVLTTDDFLHIIEAKDCAKADFSAPAHGLFLMKVNYPDHILDPANNI